VLGFYGIINISSNCKKFINFEDPNNFHVTSSLTNDLFGNNA